MLYVGVTAARLFSLLHVPHAHAHAVVQAPIYDVLLVLLTDLLVNDSITSFHASVAAGAIPAVLVDEMRGIADGAQAANALTPVTFNLIATLNYGYDFLLALIYTGEILEREWRCCRCCRRSMPLISPTELTPCSAAAPMRDSPWCQGRGVGRLRPAAAASSCFKCIKHPADGI